MTTFRSLAAAILCAGLLAACGDSGEQGLSEPTPPVPTTVSPTTAGPTSSPSSPTPCTTPPFTATTALDTESASGAILGLAKAEAGPQPCYDRVVFHLGGQATGAPGWRVEYVTNPSSDGSGNDVTVNGPAYLQVVITNVGYPPDTGVPDPAVKRFTPNGTARVREVVLDGVFEGEYTAFVGVSSKLPFRAFRLSNPARVVVDVRHS